MIYSAKNGCEDYRIICTKLPFAGAQKLPVVPYTMCVKRLLGTVQNQNGNSATSTGTTLLLYTISLRRVELRTEEIKTIPIHNLLLLGFMYQELGSTLRVLILSRGYHKNMQYTTLVKKNTMLFANMGGLLYTPPSRKRYFPAMNC